MSQDEIFNFPKLIDSNFESGIITFDMDHNNPKERFASCSLQLNELNGDISKTNFLVDFDSLYNLNYNLKSMINQIDQTIQNFNS
ncbi:MAG: hypothetical protein MJ252_24340 [archaeon]|nr:hypothetical protein [archaeon]